MSVSDEPAAGAVPRPLGAKGEATRQRLLGAAEVTFAERGYHPTGIVDITRRAGVAQGTFYLYYDSKLAIFREVVRAISHEVRRTTTVAIAGVTDRRAAERAGIAAFFRFLKERRGIYKVVLEAQFVDEPLYRWYYDRMVQGYRTRLMAAQAAGQIRPLDPEVLAWCIMGVVHMLGMHYVISADDAAAERDFEQVMDFLGHGFDAGSRQE